MASWAGVQGAGNMCSVTGPSTVSGNVSWWVQTWNSSGYGPWSSGLSFTVNSIPAKPVPYTPSGSGTGSLPNYSWSAVSGATWYYLWVNDTSGTPIKKWYQVGGAFLTCTTTVCNVMSNTAIAGNATWWVRGWNSQGDGPWSNGLSFTP